MTTIIARTHRHYEAGAFILREYLRWVRDHHGVDLVERHPQVVDEAWRTATIYGPPRGALVVAMTGFVPAGTVGIAEVAPGVAELRRMYVRPALRRRGIGTALLACGIHAARQRGFELLRLETVPALTAAAHRLYARAGFRESGPRSGAGHPGSIGMALALPAREPAA